MPSSSQWVAFLIASILFIQVPGPSLLFTIGRALTVGRREALLSVVGNGLGLVVQVLVVAVGLGAVLAASTTAYTAIKIVGAGYVVWLGIQAIRHRADARSALDAQAIAATSEVSTEMSSAVTSEVASAQRGRGHALRIGLVVGLTNPKTVLFFVAFLPQFTNASAGHTGIQLALLGVVFGVLAIASDSVWAIAAGKARDWLARKPQRLDTVGAGGGVMMIGLGALMLARE